jgi:hypothetical protein
MSDEDYRKFITGGTWTAKWASTHRDGPQVVRMGFAVEDDNPLTAVGLKSGVGQAELIAYGNPTLLDRRADELLDLVTTNVAGCSLN